MVESVRWMHVLPCVELRQVSVSTSAKNFWRLDASVAAPGCLMIFMTSRASCSAPWISFCPTALSSPCTPLPYPLRPVPPFSGPPPSPQLFFICFPCPPVPALSSSATYITSLIFLHNVHSKFRPSWSLRRTLSVPYYPYSTLLWSISSFCYSSLFFL